MEAEKLLTSKDLADALGVSESSLRRWTNNGVIRTSKTAGGHRRIPLSEAIRFIRESGAAVARPQILGLPALPTDAQGAANEGSANERLLEALKSGDEAGAKGQLLAMYLSGREIAAIVDGPVRHAMESLGELWQRSRAGILVEHRATDICLQAVNHLRHLLTPAGASAPAAVGGAPEGEMHGLASMAAASVLTEAGHRAVNYGAATPPPLLATAAAEQDADLVWMSVTYVADGGRLRREIEQLGDALASRGTPLVLGGRAVGELNVRELSNVHVLGTMGELAAFAKSRSRVGALGGE